MTTVPVTTGLTTGDEPSGGLGTGAIIGIAVGAVALSGGIITGAVLFVGVGTGILNPFAAAGAQRGLVFRQPVGGARPAYVAQNAMRYPTRMSAQLYYKQPRMNQYRPYRPGYVGNRFYDWHHHSSADWYRPQPCYRNQRCRPANRMDLIMVH